MFINQVNFNHINFRNNKIESTVKKNISQNNQTEVCSKEAASAIANQIIISRREIPEYGKLSDSIIKKCQTGEKGQIINKKTGEIVDITADIEPTPFNLKKLALYDNNQEIGIALFKKVTIENSVLEGYDEYIGDTGAIYVHYMQNDNRGKYKHVGTLLHRIMHEISKQSGCEGKMILIAAKNAAPFHYDSGFKPISSFNPSDSNIQKEAKKTELEIMADKNRSSINMYLPVENMEKLENGEHCIPEEIKNITDDEYNKLLNKFDQDWIFICINKPNERTQINKYSGKTTVDLQLK